MRDLWRRGLSLSVLIFCGSSVLLALVPLAFILFYVVTQGVTALNLDFFRHTPAPVGETGGGMANAIVGSLIVTALGALFAIPVGVLSGLYAAEYRGTRFASATRFAADTLNGVPSIVIGVFAYGVAVLPFKHFSALAGGFALGIMMIPLIMRTTEELLLLVPSSLREGALALGATRGRAVFTVVLPAALPGIVTGLRLGWTFAWRSLMAGELLHVAGGLGQLLTLGRELNDMALVIGVMAAIVALGLVFDRLAFGWLEAHVRERWGFDVDQKA